MGGSSKAKTSADSTVDNSQTVYDLSGNEGIGLSGVDVKNSAVAVADQSGNAGVLLAGNFGGGKGSVNNLTTTDLGAVEGSLDFAYQIGQGFIDFGDKALASVAQASQGAVAAVERSNNAALNRVTDLSESQSDGGSQKTILYIIGGAFVVVGVVVYVSGAKK